MNTHETYVSLEVAKLLKQAGFDWSCQSAWDLTFPDEPYLNYDAIYPVDFRNNLDDVFYAPTLAVAQKWLREVKECDVYVSPSDDLYFAHIKKYGEINPEEVTRKFIEFPNCFVSNSYESVLEAGIKKCLTLILGKNE